jgi:hypothetical protein
MVLRKVSRYDRKERDVKPRTSRELRVKFLFRDVRRRGLKPTTTILFWFHWGGEKVCPIPIAVSAFE